GGDKFGIGTEGRTGQERQSAREWRATVARSGDAGLSQVCSQGEKSGNRVRGIDASAGRIPSRRYEAQPDCEEFPGVRARRKCFEPLGSSLRGNWQGMDGA